MACIKHWNIRGLKSPSSSFQKVKKLTTKLEDVQKLSVLNIQETHLLNDNENPQRLKNFDHLYHIVPSHACQNDKGAGILIFINKTEDIIETEELVPGRLVYVKYQNKNTSEIKNLFSFYGKSHATSNEIKAHISKMNDKISENHLVNVLLCGDFNFVTSLLDRNSSHFSG
jgi:exonuclease III